MSALSSIKVLIKSILPPPSIRLYNYLYDKYRLILHDRIFKAKPTQSIFQDIYEHHWWGSKSALFCSGEGSYDEIHLKPYINSVISLFSSLPNLPRVVDLGCGDFNVGNQLFKHAAYYKACDIVPELIQRNKQVFKGENLEFLHLDLIRDPLPSGDFVIIRQVLQHLSNSDISLLLPKLASFKYVLVVEIYPVDKYVPNIDQPTGAYSRVARGLNSGVVLTAAPFCFNFKLEELICSTENNNRRILSTLYTNF